MRVLVFFYILSLCSSQLGADKKINKYVTTLINAKWNETPLVLEAAEYLSDENPSYFWKFIDSYSRWIGNLAPGNCILCYIVIGSGRFFNDMHYSIDIIFPYLSFNFILCFKFTNVTMLTCF